MGSKRAHMTIRYSNGLSLEAVLLSQTEDSMRVAARGSDDIIELKKVSGTWITDECEPVQVEYAWAKKALLDQISEDDCICSPELAARLLHLLFSGEEEPDAPSPAPRSSHLPVCHHVV